MRDTYQPWLSWNLNIIGDQFGMRTILHMYRLYLFNGDANPCVAQESKYHNR
jgi:hypothetical protein